MVWFGQHVEMVTPTTRNKCNIQPRLINPPVSTATVAWANSHFRSGWPLANDTTPLFPQKPAGRSRPSSVQAFKRDAAWHHTAARRPSRRHEAQPEVKWEEGFGIQNLGLADRLRKQACSSISHAAAKQQPGVAPLSYLMPLA